MCTAGHNNRAGELCMHHSTQLLSSCLPIQCCVNNCAAHSRVLMAVRVIRHLLQKSGNSYCTNLEAQSILQQKSTAQYCGKPSIWRSWLPHNSAPPQLSRTNADAAWSSNFSYCVSTVACVAAAAALFNQTGYSLADSNAEGPQQDAQTISQTTRAKPEQQQTTQARSARQQPQTTKLQILEGQHYQAYHANGRPVTFQHITQQLNNYDVILLGETHDDPVAHHLELEVWKIALAAAGNPTTTSNTALQPGRHHTNRQPILSLEMFETDTQVVMDEYLQGFLRDQDLLMDGRAWPNYIKDYHPLVAKAKQHGAPVICANAPRRLVSLVGKHGADILKTLPDRSQSLLPPLPIHPPSAMYKLRITDMMRAARAQPTQPVNYVSVQPEPKNVESVSSTPNMRALQGQESASRVSTVLAAPVTNSDQKLGSSDISKNANSSCNGNVAKQQGRLSDDAATSIQAQHVKVSESSRPSNDVSNADSTVETSTDDQQAGPQRECPYIGLNLSSNFFDAQNLWDATMAYNIAQALASGRQQRQCSMKSSHTSASVPPANMRSQGTQQAQDTQQQNAVSSSTSVVSTASKPLVVHVCGKAHIEYGLGIVEHLTYLVPEAKVLVVAFMPSRSIHLSPEEFIQECLVGAADFIVLTDGSLPRSFQSMHV